MGEQLDAQELRFLRQDIEAAASIVSRIGERVSELEDELRARRAADLSAEDVQVLERMRRAMDTSNWMEHQRHDSTVREHIEACERAITLLDKLTKGARRCRSEMRR